MRLPATQFLTPLPYLFLLRDNYDSVYFLPGFKYVCAKVKVCLQQGQRLLGLSVGSAEMEVVFSGTLKVSLWTPCQYSAQAVLSLGLSVYLCPTVASLQLYLPGD